MVIEKTALPSQTRKAGGLLRGLMVLGSWLGIASLVALFLSGTGTRLGLWAFGTGFSILRWSAYVGSAAAAMALIAVIWLLGRRKERPPMLLVVGLLAGLITFWMPYSQQAKARSVPPIHDITTDTQDPPLFQAILPLRANARNPPEYLGGEVTEQQLKAYPDIRTVVLRASPAQAFEAASAVVKSMGWDVAAANDSEGRIEATDTTFWYGFKDDVVIRIRPEGTGSRLDIRSKSRVGRSDIGTNAARVRKFIAELQKQAPGN
jgi:uncharacterized protein (DUF1499 family)